MTDANTAGNGFRMERDRATRAFQWVSGILLALITGLSGFTLNKVVDLGNAQSAQVERDKAQDARMTVEAAHLLTLETWQKELSDRQSARIPIFDRMPAQLEDHERRLQGLERQRPRQR